MLLILAAVVAGIGIGLALGGSLRTLGEARFRLWPLALIGLALQLVPVPSMRGRLDHVLAVGLLIGSYTAMLAFVAANIRAPGFWLIGVGFALNALVISLDGGMPVSDPALHRAAGPLYGQTLHRLESSGGAKHHLARPDDVLAPLSDVIAIGPPIRQVFSVGDVVWLAGTVWVIAGATRGPRRRATLIRPRWLAGAGGTRRRSVSPPHRPGARLTAAGTLRRRPHRRPARDRLRLRGE
jgi:uncharacterized protein DUF5317